jgi:hypothetical protein
VCPTGCDSEEVSALTCFTVVTAAQATATPNAAAKAANAICKRMSLPPICSGGPSWRMQCGDRERRDFAVKPILLMRQRCPRLRHAQVAPEGRLAVSAFRQLQTVVRVFPEYVRLLHAFDMEREREGYNEELPNVNGNHSVFRQTTGTP